MAQPQEILTKIILDNWNGTLQRTTELINSLSDDQLMEEVAPGKNRGIYLLGHLTAVNDRMLPLLGFGDQKYPELNTPFLTSPDRAVADLPTVADLRAKWNEINEVLAAHTSAVTPDEWLTRHTSVSEEDFAKEPHRNRINVLLGRTTHLSNHLGQLILLKK